MIKTLVACMMTLGFVPVSMAASLGLKTDTYYDVWAPSQKVLSKTVTSTSKQPQFFVVHLIRSGGPNVAIHDKALSTKDMVQHIFAIPNHFALLPGKSKVVRLTFPKGRHNTVEQYYRLNIVPVMPTHKLGFSDKDIALDKKVGLHAVGETNMRFGLSTALVVLPLHPHYKLHVTRANNRLHIDNSGNAVLSVTAHGQCHEGTQKKACRLAARAYPGRTLTLNISTFSPDITLYFVGDKYAKHCIVKRLSGQVCTKLKETN